MAAGEMALWRTVIDQAVKDLYVHSPIAHAAWSWIYGTDTTFGTVCAALDLDPMAVREGLHARGLSAEPSRYLMAPRVRAPGIGSGNWVQIDAARHCIACPAVFTAYKPDTRYCPRCHRERYPWKKRKRAA